MQRSAQVGADAQRVNERIQLRRIESKQIRSRAQADAPRIVGHVQLQRVHSVEVEQVAAKYQILSLPRKQQPAVQSIVVNRQRAGSQELAQQSLVHLGMHL